MTVTVTHVRRFARKPELHWPALTWLLASAIADVTITVSLAYNLVRMLVVFVVAFLTLDSRSVQAKDWI